MKKHEQRCRDCKSLRQMCRRAGCLLDKESAPGLVKSANETAACPAPTVRPLLEHDQLNLKRYSLISPNSVSEFTKLTLLVTIQNVTVGNYSLGYSVVWRLAVVVVIFKTGSRYSSYTQIIRLLPFVFISICLKQKICQTRFH